MTESDSTKDVASRLLRLAASGSVDETYTLVSPGFRHHNPYFGSDAAALKAAMRKSANRSPDTVVESQRVMAEGDRVATQARMRFRLTH